MEFDGIRVWNFKLLYKKKIPIPSFLKGIDLESLKLLLLCTSIDNEDETLHYYDTNFHEIKILSRLGLVIKNAKSIPSIKNRVYLSLTFKGWWVWWNAKRIAYQVDTGYAWKKVE